jgi:hypothetical protein
MKEPIIVHTDVKTNIRLDDQFDFTAIVTLGLSDGGDFYLIIKFLSLTMEELKTLAQLSKLQHRISIKSDLIENEKYNITHIVVTKFSSNNNLEMTWECLSDDPSLYDSISGQ